jgi:hypothetical protein
VEMVNSFKYGALELSEFRTTTSQPWARSVSPMGMEEGGGMREVVVHPRRFLSAIGRASRPKKMRLTRARAAGSRPIRQAGCPPLRA